MNIANKKLSAMMFIEYFIWGAWFVPLWLFLDHNHFTPNQIAWCFSCGAIAAIISPIFIGSIADRFFCAQKVLSFLMFMGAVFLYLAAQQTTFLPFFILLLGYNLTYMPSIALTNSIVLAHIDETHNFPKIRVFGTIGWIISGIVCGFIPALLGFSNISITNIPLVIAAISSIVLAFLALFLPNTPPKGNHNKLTLIEHLGFDALILLKDRNFKVFFICSFLFNIPASFYFIFTNGFLTESGMQHATGWLALAQVSEIFCLIALPFLIKRFGIKNIFMLNFIATAVRYLCFAYGNTHHLLDHSLLFIGILLHGVSLGIFFVLICIYADKKAPQSMRSSTQSFITLGFQGIGALLGYRIAGYLMETLFAYAQPQHGFDFNWAGMWQFGAGFITIIAVAFWFLFKESGDKFQVVELNGTHLKH